MISHFFGAFAVLLVTGASAANTYVSCCSYDGGVTCSMDSWCDASTGNCAICKGSWADAASAIDQTYLKQKSVCNACTEWEGDICKETSTEELGHACLDWNAGSVPMENAAAAYADRLALSVDETPIFAVGSVGHASPNHNMGKCFEFKLNGVSRPLILQAVNEGGDVDSGNIDVMMGAGGEGAYLGCTAPDHDIDPMFGSFSYPGVFGETAMSGGPATKAKCADLPHCPEDIDATLPSGAESLVDLCERSFDLNLRPADSSTGGNPLITARSWVACPEELVKITMLKRTDDPAVGSPVSQDAEFTDGKSIATRMMDCCKPSAGFVRNVPNFDQDYPAVMSCKADGFTRMDGSTSPYASSSAISTTTLASTTTTPSVTVTTTPIVTTTVFVTTTPVPTRTTLDPDANKCTVKFYEGNGGNRGEWTYTMTVEGKGATKSKDWKNSNKNDELSSLCISQPGCKVYLYKNKKLRGTPKIFSGLAGSTKNKGCGTFWSKSDLMTTQGGPWGTTHNFNDEVTSFKVVAAP